MTNKANLFRKKILAFVFAFALLWLMMSCSTNSLLGTTKIADLLASPSQYANSVVRVKGKVTESFILLETGYFMIADGTGAIAVIPSRTYPKSGEEVTVKGQVKNAFVIGDKSLTVIVENSQ